MVTLTVLCCISHYLLSFQKVNTLPMVAPTKVLQPTTLPNMSLFQEVDQSVSLRPFVLNHLEQNNTQFVVENPRDLRNRISALSQSSSQASSRYFIETSNLEIRPHLLNMYQFKIPIDRPIETYGGLLANPDSYTKALFESISRGRN